MVTQIRSNSRAAHVLLDSSAYRHNLARVRELTPSAKVMAVIKADGYGHGMRSAALALESAEEFAVTCLDDVARLSMREFNKPMTLLSGRFATDKLNQMSADQLRPVIYDYAQLASIEAINADAILDIWLKVDSGMGRLGFSLDDATILVGRLQSVEGIRSISAMTHLANADVPAHPENDRQLAAFAEFCANHPFREVSVLNSAGICAFASSAGDIVRPGLMLYGISPVQGKTSIDLGLKPVMTFKSELISVRQLPAGSAIGYGSTYTLDTDSRIGVVACGYGDGYPRHAVNGTPVLVNGMLAPLIGRVSMDLLTVDLGQVSAQVGDEVVLWGADNPIETVAESAGTIAYELTCGITSRVERIEL